MRKMKEKMKTFVKKHEKSLKVAGIAVASVGLTVAGTAFGLWLGDSKKNAKRHGAFEPIDKDTFRIILQEEVRRPGYVYQISMTDRFDLLRDWLSECDKIYSNMEENHEA